MAFTLVTVTGTFIRSDGTPQTGQGTATLSHRVENGTTGIEPTPIPFQLDASGHVVNMSGLALQLEANDDTGTTPTGSYYQFTLDLDNAPLDPFDAVISHTAGTVDLSSLIPSLP